MIPPRHLWHQTTYELSSNSAVCSCKSQNCRRNWRSFKSPSPFAGVCITLQKVGTMNSQPTHPFETREEEKSVWEELQKRPV